MSRRVAIITGMNGMDAKTLTHFLLKKGYKVILTYRRNTSQDINNIKLLFDRELKENSQSSLEFEFMDITDQNSVRLCIKGILNNNIINEFYNLAAQSHVADSFLNPLFTIQTNGVGVYYILETLRETSPQTRIYQASSSELFGGDPKVKMFNENSRFECRSPYSIGKLVGLNWVRYYRQTYGMFAASGILFNHSNIYRNRSFFIRKVVSTAAKIALGKENQIKLGNLEHYRDEHYSDFGCEIMWRILQQNKPDDYVVGNGVAHAAEEYLDITFNYFNLNWKKYLIFDSKFVRPNEVVKLTSDPSKAEKELGWRRNRISFKDHIELMCAYDLKLEMGECPIYPNVFSMYP